MSCSKCNEPISEHVMFGTKWGLTMRVCPQDIIEEVIA
jgi:hypothetical protein